MSTKNEARRLKKKAERAKNRAIVVKERIRLMRSGSASKEQFTNSVRKSILDSLTIVGIMDQTLFTMSRLKTLIGNIISRNPVYHNEELNQKFVTVGNESNAIIKDMQTMRQIFVTYSEQLENPKITMAELSETATKIQRMKTNENELMDSCADTAKEIVALVDESNALREAAIEKAATEDSKYAEEDIRKLLSDEEYKLLCIYAGLNVDTVPVIGNEQIPLRSGFMRPADEPIAESASEVTTYTSEYKTTFPDDLSQNLMESAQLGINDEPSVQQVLTDYATDDMSKPNCEQHVDASESATIE